MFESDEQPPRPYWTVFRAVAELIGVPLAGLVLTIAVGGGLAPALAPGRGSPTVWVVSSEVLVSSIPACLGIAFAVLRRRRLGKVSLFVWVAPFALVIAAVVGTARRSGLPIAVHEMAGIDCGEECLGPVLLTTMWMCATAYSAVAVFQRWRRRRRSGWDK